MIVYVKRVLCVLCVFLVSSQVNGFFLNNLLEEEQVAEQDDTLTGDEDAGLQIGLQVQDPSINSDQPADTVQEIPSIDHIHDAAISGGSGTPTSDDGDGKNRTKRNYECDQPSPPGVKAPCISCDGSDSIEFTDVTGLKCRCEICRPPKYMHIPCLCTADYKVLSGPTCSLPIPGKEFMPYSNWCDGPFICSECKGDLEVTVNCTSTTDTLCDCPKGSYHTSETTCSPILPCDVDYEIHELPDTEYRTYECRRCEEGFTQPNANSLDRCRRIEEKQVDITEPPVTGDGQTPGQTDGQTDGQTTEASDKDLSVSTEESLPSSQEVPSGNVNCPVECPCPASTCTEPQPSSDSIETTVYETDKNCTDTPENSENQYWYWYIIVLTLLAIGIVVGIPSALIYGGKHPEKVESFSKKIWVHEWFYDGNDQYSGQGRLPFGSSSGSLQNISTQDDGQEETQRLNPGSGEDETRTSWTRHSAENVTGHRLFDEESAKGGRRGQAQKKYSRERSVNQPDQ